MVKIIVYGDCVFWNVLFSQKLWKKVDKEIIIYPIETNIENTYKKDDIILPMMERHFIFLMSYGYTNKIFPSLENMEIFMDKIKFLNFFESFSLYFPKVYKENIYFPCISKKKNLCNGQESNIHYDNTKMYISDINQEYIPGNVEYTSHILFIKLSIKLIITYKYTFSEDYYIKSENTVPISMEKIVLEKEYENIISNMLKFSNYNGICNVDFKINNGIKIFEINPRFGGSLMLKENKKDLILFLKKIYRILHQKKYSLEC